MREAPPLSAAERARRRRALATQVGGTPELAGSLLVAERRYDVWRSEERVAPAPVVPLVTFAIQARIGAVTYESLHPGPPFVVAGLETLSPRRAAERLAVIESAAYDERQAQLEPYRRRAAQSPGSATRLYELALMIWYQHFRGSPGPLAQAVPPLQRALELQPLSAHGHGLLGEVQLRAGRPGEALSAFLQAARLLPRHPRYHYCASVAHELVGDAAAAKHARARARSAAGPRLKKRFTPASNPLEDFRYSLLCEAVRLREKHEGVVRLSARAAAERDRALNRIRPSRVPRDLRVLIPLAEKWGIGDDTSRAWFLRRATATEKRQLRKASARYGRRISDWLDSQLPGRPTAETGCFLYLLEACEELG